jgi:hypothetical protein
MPGACCATVYGLRIFFRTRGDQEAQKKGYLSNARQPEENPKAFLLVVIWTRVNRRMMYPTQSLRGLYSVVLDASCTLPGDGIFADVQATKKVVQSRMLFVQKLAVAYCCSEPWEQAYRSWGASRRATRVVQVFFAFKVVIFVSSCR